MAEGRRDCNWLHIVTDCDATPQLQDPVRDSARLGWHKVMGVAHYYISVDAMEKPMPLRENSRDYGRG